VLVARTDVVGSLLRPAFLLEARGQLEAGVIAEERFAEVEDAAVDHALALQEEAGLEVVTDGEMRRLSFQSQLPAAVDGFADWDLDAFLWGEWHSDELGDMNVERPPLAVAGKLQRRRFLSAAEFTYARDRTERVLKVTLPSPSLFANFWNPDRPPEAYATLEEYLGDVAEILREEVDELVRLGARYIQLDAPHYPLLLDPGYRDFYESRGWPADRWLDLGLELDNLVIGDHPGVTFGMHLCRGNRGGMHRVGRRAVAKLALIIGPRAPCRSRSIEATGVEMADGHHGVDRACTHDLAVDHPEAEGDASGRHSAIVTLPLGEQAPRVTAQAHDRGQRRNVAGAESAVVVPTPTPGCGAGVERARRAVEVR